MKQLGEVDQSDDQRADSDSQQYPFPIVSADEAGVEGVQVVSTY